MFLSVYPSVSLPDSSLCAVCFNAHPSIPIIPISLPLCVSVCLHWSVWLGVFTLFYFLSGYILLSSKPFLSFCLLCPPLPLLLSCFSSNLLQLFFPDSLFHLPPSLLASAQCFSFLRCFFFLGACGKVSHHESPCLCSCMCVNLTAGPVSVAAKMFAVFT